MSGPLNNYMKTIIITCDNCGKLVEKPLKEIKRQQKAGRTHFFCNSECSVKNKKGITKFLTGKGNCEFCGIEINIKIGKRRNKKCCSDLCAKRLGKRKTLERYPDINNNLSMKIKEKWKIGIYKDIVSKRGQKKRTGLESKSIARKSICTICNNIFDDFNYKPKKTCSKECLRLLNSNRAKQNPNCGGETNYKRYIYKDILMDSSWEVDIAQFLDKNSIEWKRSRTIMFWWTDLDGNKRRYYPDFYLPKYNVYLDPKNKFLISKDRYKLEQVIKENNINLIYGLKDRILEKIANLQKAAML